MTTTVTMNIINFITRTGLLWLLLSFGVATARAESGAIFQLQERFPDSVKLHTDKQLSLEFCPDNTCDLFVTKRSTSVQALSDFAFLYLYFFSDYFVLGDWRTEDAARNTAAGVLKKYSGQKCSNGSETEMAQCVLRDWARRNAIRLYWVRYDEKGRHLQARSIREATKSK